MKKQHNLKYESISFDEFIDCITDGKGEEIKRQIRLMEPKKMKGGDKNG